MPACKLSATDRQEICQALRGLSGPRLAAQIRHLAAFYGVHTARIYEATRGVRPERKKRSDAGRRKIDLMDNAATRGIAEFVANQKVSPELAALTVAANPEIFGELPDLSLGTIRRYVREHGISRTQAKSAAITYRPFEAAFPGEIFQFDISGVKERWVDVKTRSIHKVDSLDVSENHPNKRSDRVPLWKFTLVDDKSRKKFVRFVAVSKPNTVNIVEFLKEAFLAMGLPHKLYTDNDSVIVNKRTERGTRFLNEAFAASGGFAMIQHAPGRPQATGKVERTHQSIEEYERLIGVKVDFGTRPTVEQLNRFAEFVTEHRNAKMCKATGVIPNIAWRATTNPLRMIDAAQFEAAFKARDLNLRIHADITIRVDGVKYQLPRGDKFPFGELALSRGRLDVFWIDDESQYAVITPAGDQFMIEKVEARADRSGEFKALPETRRARSQKSLKASQRERIAAVKEARKTTDEPVFVVPGIDVDLPIAASEKVLEFPRAVESGDTVRLNELTHHLADASPEFSPLLDTWAALEYLQAEHGVPAEPCAELAEIKDWLRSAFGGSETISEADLIAAFNDRQPAAVKRAG